LKRACILLSGGKDSNYAFWRAVREGFQVSCIVSVRPKRRDSWMFHYPLAEAVRLQVKLAGYEDRYREIHVSGEKEIEVYELLVGLKEIKREFDFEYLVVGGIASVYQKRRFELIAKELGTSLYAPQWGMDPFKYLFHLIDNGFKFIISEIKVYGLTKDFIGKIVTKNLAYEIVKRAKKYGFNPAFEGGEAETLTLYQPLFGKHMLCVEGFVRSLSEFEHVLEVTRTWIGERNGEDCVNIVKDND
jgi:diphthine-ammonia ligase